MPHFPVFGAHLLVFYAVLLHRTCQHRTPGCWCRFSTLAREYKYLFVQDGALDLDAMQCAGDHLRGMHDFRNFCKVDAAHVASFCRTVLDFRIVREPGTALAGSAIYAMHIRGTAFLWHQVCFFQVSSMRRLVAMQIVRWVGSSTSSPACNTQHTVGRRLAYH